MFTATRSNQGHIATLHTYTLQPIFLTNINKRYSPENILKVKVTTARSNHGYTMMLHTYTTQVMSLPSINCLHFKVSEMHTLQTFPAAHLNTMEESNSHTALSDCGEPSLYKGMLSSP